MEIKNKWSWIFQDEGWRYSLHIDTVDIHEHGRRQTRFCRVEESECMCYVALQYTTDWLMSYSKWLFCVSLKALLQNPIFSAALDQSLNGSRLSSKIIANFLFNGEEKDRPAGMPAFDWRNVFNTTSQVAGLIKQVMGVSVSTFVLNYQTFLLHSSLSFRK